MYDFKESFVYKIWFLAIMLLVSVNLIFISLHLSSLDALGPNPSDGIFGVENKSFGAAVSSSFKRSLHKANAEVNGFANAATHAVAGSFGFVGQTGKSGIAFASDEVRAGYRSLAKANGQVASTLSDATNLNSFIKPSEKITVTAPVISPLPAPDERSTNTASPPASANSQSVAQVVQAAQWPIRGSITTAFGVPEWPYEAIHSGIDISDGKPAGTTPVHPYSPGQVAEVVRSGGLGNHVVIDHGGGITSVYGHLSSVAVQVGEKVNDSSVIGYEGSTGVSTGTHLHFEIRESGRAIDPHRFIAGQP